MLPGQGAGSSASHLLLAICLATACETRTTAPPAVKVETQEQAVASPPAASPPEAAPVSISKPNPTPQIQRVKALGAKLPRSLKRRSCSKEGEKDAGWCD